MKSKLVRGLFLLSVLTPPLSAKPEDYVEYVAGDYPLILAVPHDGLLKMADVPERSNPKNLKGFKKGRDQNTSVVAHKVREAFQAKTGKKPYLVIMKLSRKWIDVNREEARAVEHEQVAEVYRLFYAKLHEAKKDIIGKFGKGLLLDIHCGASWKYDVYFGNYGGSTIKPLVKREGKEAYSGPFSIQQTLAARGYEIPGYNNIPFKQGPTGNLIHDLTRAEKDLKLDGIEIEINSKRHLNKAPVIQKFADDFGAAVMTFAEQYYGK